MIQKIQVDDATPAKKQKPFHPAAVKAAYEHVRALDRSVEGIFAHKDAHAHKDANVHLGARVYIAHAQHMPPCRLPRQHGHTLVCATLRRQR